MVGKQGIAERTRAKKFSNLVNAKTQSPKKVGTTSNASTGGPKGIKKKSREADDSDIVIVPSSSPETETDDGIEFLYEGKVEIDDELKKGKRNGEERRATKKGVDKQNGIKIKDAEAKPEKKKMNDVSRPETDDGMEILYKEKVEIEDESKKGKRNGQKSRASKKGVDKQTGTKVKEADARPEKKEMNDASRRQSEGKEEDKKKLKKVEEEEEEKIGATKQRGESKKHDKKPKGKEVEAKSPEKSNKGRDRDVNKLQTEGKIDDRKTNVDGEKERTSKRQNEGEKEDKRNEKRQKMNWVEVEQQSNGANKRRDHGQKEDKKQKIKVAEAGKQRNEANKRRDEGAEEEDKKDNKRRKKEVAEAEKQMNETNKKQNEGAKEERKQKNKKQKKKVAEGQEQRSEAGQQGRQGKKEEKKDKKKKNKEVEIETEDEEENDKTNNALYKFPMSRVSRIIKSADLNNKIAQEAVFVINKSSEKFLELFCREAYACAFLDHKNHLAYNHLSSVVSRRRRFDFLSDFVPEKVKAEAALAEMSEMSKAETETEIET